ncbi:hypothetical protein [Ktedonospora formicarum]|uniref:hypothetical protein n=1 Tax=Ktedonospora formicarum TaxID=2778364 RepID=UPI001C688F6E|nr:hypothetical protein [Ktedonospora formicarum]
MRKALKVLLCGVLLVAALFVSAFTSMAPSAHAAQTKSTSAAVTCYGQAVTSDTATWPAMDTSRFPSDPNYDFVTTGYCQDINIKFLVLTHPMEFQVCFDRTGTCNSWKTLSQTNHWYLLATDVLPGTKYHLNVRLAYTTTFKWMWAD